MSWALRRDLLAIARRTVAAGLTRGTSGNVSVRVGEGFIVTPSGVPYDELAPSDLVAVRMDGTVAGRGTPSSEWRIHRDVYSSRPEAQAVVHVHPPFATTIACMRRDLPAVHYMIAVAGGAPVRCAPYATFGTEELSRVALAALEGRTACLLANHGLVTTGASLPEAYRVAEEVEGVAELYWRSLCAGEPVLLDKLEMDAAMAAFRTYGRTASGTPH